MNTLPDLTLAAVLDHGDFAISLLADAQSIALAAAVLDGLGEDVSLAAVTQRIEDDGVAAFEKAYDELLATVASKIQAPN